MPWPPDIAGQLPASRDDEPANLRQDIADELADHLHSALGRELHATRDETKAKENVLERFGNPATIALKLWSDAMWEKIMS
ncbi:MAG: HAAS signaling domain-containing protein, partial [Planctomycetaceae bacterium]